MRLYSFQIKNFKSIIDTGECKISELDNVVVLAGQNESGKTSVLEALDFFGNGPSANFTKFEKRQGTDETTVMCRFIIEESDIDSIKESFVDNDNVAKFIEKKKDVLLIRRFKDGEDEGIDVDDTFFETFPEDNIDASADISNEPTVGVASTSPSSVAPARVGESRENLIVGIKAEIISLIPIFSLYRSFEHFLPSEILVSGLKDNEAVGDFEKVFEVNLQEIVGITDPRERKIKIKEIQRRATDDFNKSWNQTIHSVKGSEKYSFSIEPNDATPKKIIFMVEGEDGVPLYLEQKSTGFRWFSAFHLRLRALMKEAEGNADEGSSNIVILIDEPGQNLHDVAQRDVKKILNETADKQIQIIYSTHNPNLIGDLNTNEIEFTRIRLVSNDKKQGTRVYNISQFISRRSGGSMDALSPIRTAMGLNSTGSLFDGDKLNVVVEGITDHYYLTALRDLLGYDNRLSFIPVCGVDNVKSLLGMLIGWGMDYKAVFDDDPEQGRKAYNTIKKSYFEDNDDLAHEHVFKIKKCNGIEDIFSKSDFRRLASKTGLSAEEKKMSNSELATKLGKELIGRKFLETAHSMIAKKEVIGFDKTTSDNIKVIFDWLYEKFLLNKCLAGKDGTQSSPNLS